MLELEQRLNQLFAVKPARKATKAQAIASAKRAGCTLVISGGHVSLDPPTGYTFYGDSHYRDYYYSRTDGELWGDIWESVVDLCSRVEPCELGCPDCVK
jgi:hypothetical protein